MANFNLREEISSKRHCFIMTIIIVCFSRRYVCICSSTTAAKPSTFCQVHRYLGNPAIRHGMSAMYAATVPCIGGYPCPGNLQLRSTLGWYTGYYGRYITGQVYISP